jgi:hypothetical protein
MGDEVAGRLSFMNLIHNKATGSANMASMTKTKEMWRAPVAP